MLKPIADLPEAVIGFEAVGRIEADDYRDVLDPAVAAAEQAHGKVRLLLVLGDEYDGFSAGALLQDSKLGVSERKAWERIALVTDHERLSELIGLFAWLVPGEVRTFATAERAAAATWLGAA